jgi:hypothetical protein
VRALCVCSWVCVFMIHALWVVGRGSVRDAPQYWHGGGFFELLPLSLLLPHQPPTLPPPHNQTNEQARLDLDEAQKSAYRQELERMEAEHRREQRRRLTTDDFDPLVIIGRGAFGEVGGVRVCSGTGMVVCRVCLCGGGGGKGVGVDGCCGGFCPPGGMISQRSY